MESCHATGRLARIDATLLPTCQSLRAIHARSHATYSFVTHQTRLEASRATKLRRTYLLCGYEASSLTQGHVVDHTLIDIVVFAGIAVVLLDTVGVVQEMTGRYFSADLG